MGYPKGCATQRDAFDASLSFLEGSLESSGEQLPKEGLLGKLQLVMHGDNVTPLGGTGQVRRQVGWTTQAHVCSSRYGPNICPIVFSYDLLHRLVDNPTYFYFDAPDSSTLTACSSRAPMCCGRCARFGKGILRTVPMTQARRAHRCAAGQTHAPLSQVVSSTSCFGNKFPHCGACAKPFALVAALHAIPFL